MSRSTSSFAFAILLSASAVGCYRTVRGDLIGERPVPSSDREIAVTRSISVSSLPTQSAPKFRVLVEDNVRIEYQNRELYNAKRVRSVARNSFAGLLVGGFGGAAIGAGIRLRSGDTLSDGGKAAVAAGGLAVLGSLSLFAKAFGAPSPQPVVGKTFDGGVVRRERTIQRIPRDGVPVAFHFSGGSRIIRADQDGVAEFNIPVELKLVESAPTDVSGIRVATAGVSERVFNFPHSQFLRPCIRTVSAGPLLATASIRGSTLRQAARGLRLPLVSDSSAAFWGVRVGRETGWLPRQLGTSRLCFFENS